MEKDNTQPDDQGKSPGKLRTLLREFEADGVRYCHWKSNNRLPEALSGETDFDVLVHYQDAESFNRIISAHGFRRAVGPRWDSHSSIFHYYGLDEDSGHIVHLHVYYRLITGGGLVKDFRLPMEDRYLNEARVVDGARLPAKHLELIVFCVRKVLEHTDPLELLMLMREGAGVRREIEWLSDEETVARAKALGGEVLPAIQPELLIRCIDGIVQRRGVLSNFLTGWKIQRRLARYSNSSFLKRGLTTVGRFFQKCRQKFFRRGHINRLDLGGRVIAVIGGEATGKSTVVSTIHEWLGEYLKIHRVHAGKPPSNWLTWLPNALLPLARRLFPKQRSGVVELAAEEESVANTSLVFALRAASLAYDRCQLLTGAYRSATRGEVTVCDRYPTHVTGDIDSAMLPPRGRDSSLYRILQQTEERLYRSIPSPDLVLRLSVPVEVAIERNRTRDKEGEPEPEDYVRQRHARVGKLDYRDTKVIEIDTNKSLEETLLDVKRAVWSII